MLFVPSGRTAATEQRDVDSHFVVSVDPATGWGHVVARGNLCQSILESFMLVAWANDRYAASERAIWDLRDARLEVGLEDAPALEEFARKHKDQRGPGRVAVVIDPLRDRKVRNACRIFEEAGGFAPVLFADYYAAAEWLAADSEG